MKNVLKDRELCNLVIIDEVFDSDEIDLILKNGESLKMNKSSTMGSSAEESVHIRRSENGWLSSFDGDKHFNEVVRRVNDNIFGFQLHEDEKQKAAQFTEYKGQDRGTYDWHVDAPLGVKDYRGFDTLSKKTSWRKLSVILMLSDPESYDGGEVSILDPSAHIDECIQSFKLDKGSMVIFPSFVSHKVHPVTRGIRKTLVKWYEGNRWQ